MTEMLTDLMQNIYGRISQLGKSIKSLQGSLDSLNQTLTEKVTTLVDSIRTMTVGVEKEGEAQNLIFQQIGENCIIEISKLQEKIGLKDLDELMGKLTQIVESSEVALKPEIVDVLLHEVLTAVNQIKEGGKSTIEDEESLLDKIGSNLSGGGKKTESEPSQPEQVSPPASSPPPGSPPPGSPPPGSPPPGSPPPGSPPPGSPPPGNPPPGNPPPGNPPPS
jgi:hypothetical protein